MTNINTTKVTGIGLAPESIMGGLLKNEVILNTKSNEIPTPNSSRASLRANKSRGLINDSISDMLTRIRNATLAKKTTVLIPHTKLTQQIAQILEKEGFISGFFSQQKLGTNPLKDGSGISNTTLIQDLIIRLKYRTKKIYNGKIKESCIINLKRISKPGLRIYANSREIPRILGGTGLVIISTSYGLMTDIEARSRGLGGELLCSVW